MEADTEYECVCIDIPPTPEPEPPTPEPEPPTPEPEPPTPEPEPPTPEPEPPTPTPEPPNPNPEPEPEPECPPLQTPLCTCLSPDDCYTVQYYIVDNCTFAECRKIEDHEPTPPTPEPPIPPQPPTPPGPTPLPEPPPSPEPCPTVETPTCPEGSILTTSMDYITKCPMLVCTQLPTTDPDTQKSVVDLPINNNIEVVIRNIEVDNQSKNIYGFRLPALANSKGIKTIRVLNSGGNYNNSIQFTNIGDAIAVAKIKDGKVFDIVIVDGGRGFTDNFSVQTAGAVNTSPMEAVAIVENGSITQIQIVDPGSGYEEQPEITFSGGGGVGAQALAVVKNSQIDKIYTTVPGQNYTGLPTVYISGGGGGAAHADVNELTTIGQDKQGIASILVTNGGSGFSDSNKPQITIQGGGGAGGGGKANAIVVNGSITAINIENPGEYTSQPQIVITGGDGNATAIVGDLKGIVSDNDFYSHLSNFTCGKCTYTFTNIPSSHPITFYSDDANIILTGDKSITKIGLNGQTQEYYYGTVTMSPQSNLLIFHMSVIIMVIWEVKTILVIKLEVVAVLLLYQ